MKIFSSQKAYIQATVFTYTTFILCDLNEINGCLYDPVATLKHKRVNIRSVDEMLDYALHVTAIANLMLYVSSHEITFDEMKKLDNAKGIDLKCMMM